MPIVFTFITDPALAATIEPGINTVHVEHALSVGCRVRTLLVDIGPEQLFEAYGYTGHLLPYGQRPIGAHDDGFIFVIYRRRGDQILVHEAREATEEEFRNHG